LDEGVFDATHDLMHCNFVCCKKSGIPTALFRLIADSAGDGSRGHFSLKKPTPRKKSQIENATMQIPIAIA
jgi:hypothetical protein